jgi:ABC-type nitrate/sulfonate/bicarbonate transport system substrate-binding protein
LATKVFAQATPVLPTVRVATQAFDDMIAMLYAQRMGWFARAGLDVQVERQTTSGAAIGAAILGGTFDIGKMGLSDVIEAHEKGIPFVVIAPAGIYTSAVPISGLLVLKNGPIFSGKDLNGKIVAQTSLGDIGSVTLDSWMDQNGGDWRSIRYVEMPMSAIPAAIEAGRVDAGGSLEPVLAQALASGKFRFIPTYSAVAPAFVYAVWVTTRDWADQHRAIVKTLAAVLAQSATYTNAHHADTAAMLSDFSSIPVERIESMPRITIGTTLRASQIQPLIEAAVRDHTIAHAFPAAEILDADTTTK